jgi:hypothetical protein
MMRGLTVIAGGAEGSCVPIYQLVPSYPGAAPRYALLMAEAIYLVGTIIRPALSEDADGIAHAFLESAEYHARLDPERYSSPAVETVSAHYRKLPDTDGESITLVAELDGEVVGFIDALLDRSQDAMHLEMIYCHIAEIAVNSQY